MRAVRVVETGAPEVLRVEELPTPSAGPGQVLVRVAAAGVNFMDVILRSGAYPRALPIALGFEGAGVVEAVGPGVTDYRAGERVAWILAWGSYATLTIVPVANLVRLPDGLDFNAAAASLYQGMTAHHLAVDTYPLKPGDTCVVHSGAGGVGSMLCQIARLQGARVFATVSDEAKAAAARAAGAEHVVVDKNQNWAEIVRGLTDGKGVNVVYDAVGADTFEMSLLCLKPRGLLALYGESSGVVPLFDLRRLSRLGSLFVTRSGLDTYIATPAEFAERANSELDWVAEGRLRPHIDRTLPLHEAAAAHHAIGSRKTVGKLLLVP